MSQIVGVLATSFCMALNVGIATDSHNWGMAAMMFGLLLGQIAVRPVKS